MNLHANFVEIETLSNLYEFRSSNVLTEPYDYYNFDSSL